MRRNENGEGAQKMSVEQVNGKGNASSHGAPAVMPDTGTHEQFYEYYARQSVSDETVRRFQTIKDIVLAVRRHESSVYDQLEIADIGCGAGTQSLMWAQDGHKVHGIDISDQLIKLGQERAREQGLPIEFVTGTATTLPWPSESMDVCLVPELLEHVAEWQQCIDEFTRILKPGGLLFLTTNNTLCPVQQEFNLPFYSWYPRFLKHRYERLAVTTRPELVNYAKYPAVNWFTYYGLRKTLAARNFRSLDKFDAARLAAGGGVRGWVLQAICWFSPMRFAAHMMTPYTLLVAIKNAEPATPASM